MPVRLALGLGLFLGSLLTGWSLGRSGWLTPERAHRLIRFVVRCVSPLVLCLLFWRLQLRDARTLTLPLIGLAVMVAAIPPAWLYARQAGLSRPQAGSFLTCAIFSNVGYMGAFISFALFGEPGYALATLYFVFFNPCFFLLGFTVAKRFGAPIAVSSTPGVGADELRLFPFLGLCVGVLLNLAKIPRPPACELVNHLLIPMDTALYVTAIASQLQFEPLAAWWRPGLAMSAIKFLYCPLIGWLLASALRIEPVAKAIVMIEASTPVAVSPLMLPLVFGLDRRLSNALWLWTTLLAIPVLVLGLPFLISH